MILFNQLKVQTWLQQAVCTCIDKLSSKNIDKYYKKKMNEKFIQNK